MSFCRINGKQYLVDFDRMEFYSVQTSRTFTFSGDVKISQLKKYLAKYDA